MINAIAARTSIRVRPFAGLMNSQWEKAKPGAGDAKISTREPVGNQCPSIFGRIDGVRIHACPIPGCATPIETEASRSGCGGKMPMGGTG